MPVLKTVFNKMVAALVLGTAVISGCSDDASPAPTGPRRPIVATESFCAERPLLQFCEDFDGKPLPGRFTTAKGSEAFAIDSALSTSAPSSLIATLDPTKSLTAAARLERSFAWGKKLRGLVQIRPDSNLGGTGESSLRVASIEFADGDDVYRVSLSTNARGEWFGEESTEKQGAAPVVKRLPSSVQPAANAWASVRLEVDLDEAKTGGKLTIKIGTENAVEAVPLASPLLARDPNFVLGLDGTLPQDAATPWGVRFDTITFTVD